MIRLIRKISAQLIIREYFFSNTNRTNLTNLLGCDPVCIRGRLLPFGQWVFDKSRGQEPAASGHACKSVWNPYASKKNKGQKNPCQRLRCICDNPWAFFDLRPVAAGSQDELWCKAYPWGCEGKCEGRKFTLTLTLTTETPINRAFQANCEGVRVEKEKSCLLCGSLSLDHFSMSLRRMLLT